MTETSSKKHNKNGNGNGHDSLAADYLRSAILGQGPGETNSFTPRDMERVDREMKLIEKMEKAHR